MGRRAPPEPAGGAPSAGQALAWGGEVLARSGIANGRMESAWILADLAAPAGRPRRETLALLLAERALPLPRPAWRRYRQRVLRRARREPLAYLLGTQEFLGLDFLVTPSVLVPRPETELLARAAVEKIASLHRPLAADVGTGSGVLAVALARAVPAARVVAGDVSTRALAVARKNAARHGVAGRIDFVRSDLFASLPAPAAGFDLIVSNPPYVRRSELNSLQAEVRREPRRALDGGKDGLRVVGPLIRAAPARLRAGGWLLLEVGYDQAGAATAMLARAGYGGLTELRDQSGIARVVGGIRPR